MWGVYYSLDGFVLILGATEFTILLVFMLVSTRLPLYLKSNLRGIKGVKSLMGIFFGFYLLVSQPILTYTINFCNYYAISSQVVSADFFIFFYIFFIKYPILVFLLTLLLGLLSIYFIVLFYCLKQVSVNIRQEHTTYNFIRRQTLVKQATFISSVRTMQ